MKVFRLIKRDLSIGFLRNIVLLLIPVIIAILQCHECYRIFTYLKGQNLLKTDGTIMDYHLFCTQGMFVFHFDPREYFSIPIYWFAFQICISYLIGYYAYQDFLENGVNLFLALKDRVSWWKSKCLWVIGMILAYYLVFEITICLAADIFGGAEWEVHYTVEFISRVFGTNMGQMSVPDVILISLLVPCFVTVGLCLLQVLIGFLFTPVVSFACICMVYVLSAYYTSWFLPGNYTMWLRSTYLTEEGVGPVSGMLLGVLLILLTFYLGKMYFQNKDIL